MSEFNQPILRGLMAVAKEDYGRMLKREGQWINYDGVLECPGCGVETDNVYDSRAVDYGQGINLYQESFYCRAEQQRYTCTRPWRDGLVYGKRKWNKR